MMAGCVAALMSLGAAQAETLKISTWGGSWRDALDRIVGKRFTEQTGATLEYTTGNSIIRLNREKLAQGADVPDIVYTTGQVGWLYRSSNLIEDLDLAKLPNFESFPKSDLLSPAHIGVWSYVYAICYRSSLTPAGMTFTSWKDLWDARVKGMLGVHQIDPSHVIGVATKLAGVPPTEWEKAQPLMLQLKPIIKAFYSSDAMSQSQMSSGETPISLALASNCVQLSKTVPDLKIAIPSEGPLGTSDAIAIMKASTKKDLAYKYLNILLDPQVQAEVAQALAVSPANSKAVLPDAFKATPGIYASPEKFQAETIQIDNKLRADKLAEWGAWYTENMTNR